MAGTRIFSNHIIPTTDWNNEYVPVQGKLVTRAPLPVLASFDLLNPIDNSGNGYILTRNGGKINPTFLHYDNGAKPSETSLTKAGQGAVSFVTAFRLAQKNRYINILSCRDVTSGNGHGFNLYFGGPLLLGFAYASGATGATTSPGDPELNKWYVASGVFDPVNLVASIRISDLGLGFVNIGGNVATNKTLDSKFCIGGGPDGSTTASMQGDVAFCTVYDGAFSATVRDSMIDVGMEILRDRELIE